MAKATNYRRWQFEMVAPFVKGKVLEIGGGIGNFTLDLARVAESVISIEPNADCYRRLLEKARLLSNVAVYNAPVEALEQQIGPDLLVDTAVCMNVLEHVADDEAAIRLFSRRLKMGGRLVLLIPAVPLLFGEIDRRLGHYRRYSMKRVRLLMQEAGLTLIKARYFNFIGLWAWLWNARFARSTTQSDFQIRLFDRYIVPWQSRIEAVLAPFIGQSLLAVAQKDKGREGLPNHG